MILSLPSIYRELLGYESSDSAFVSFGYLSLRVSMLELLLGSWGGSAAK